MLYFLSLLEEESATRNEKQLFYLKSSANRYQGKLGMANNGIARAINQIDWGQLDSLDAEILFLSAQLHTDIGQYDEAISEYQQAIRVYRMLGHAKGIGKCLNSIALTYYRINDLEKTKEYNQQASLIWERHPYPLGVASSHTIAGYMQASRQEFTLAVRSLEKARDIYAQINDRERFANSYLNIGEVYLKQGNHAEAAKFFKESLSISRGLNYTQIYVDGLNKLGQSYTRQGKFQLARDTLLAGLALAEKIKDRALLGEFYKHFSELYQATGDYRRAFEFQKKFENQKDSIFQSERALRMAEYEVQYQTNEVTQQNKILREKSRQRLIYIGFLAVLVLLVILLVALFYSRSRMKIKYLEQEKNLNETLIRQQQLENEKLETEAQLKEEENQKLQLEIAYKRKELSSTALHLYQKNESLQRLLEEISRIEKAGKNGEGRSLQPLKKSISQNLNLDEDWERFLIHFNQVHQGFIEKLARQFTALSQQDLRHCAYIRINLSTKEISRLLNINPTSVQKSRVRLKKKLGLPAEVNLFDFIQHF
ncbi:MAG: tetratricopeptide repeat protein [Bacteroidota bacterium]